MPIIVKDGNGNITELAPNAVGAVAVGIGTARVGNALEVTGAILSRTSEDVGGTAVSFVAEGPGLASIHTSADYNPDRPGRNFIRTLTLFNGNVGIGRNFGLEKLPAEGLEVEGNILATGDVKLTGADCAEEFEIDGTEVSQPGAVMVISDDEKLCQCVEAYDTRVAGVISGAADFRPGIVLGKRPLQGNRMPLALTGKVYCKVDADYGAVATGDLLTTSPTPGHAMKATEQSKAHGAVLGKALRPLQGGRGLIPVLVSLQ